MKTYKYAALRPGELADGRPLARGDTVQLSPDQAKDPHNERLIDGGQLIHVPQHRKDGDA